MVITVEQLAKLAKAFREPDPQYAAVAEAWRRERAKSPAQHRAELEKLLSIAAELEIGGGPWSKHAGVARRLFASELFTGRSHAPRRTSGLPTGVACLQHCCRKGTSEQPMRERVARQRYVSEISYCEN